MATTDMIRFENVKKIYTGLDAKSKDIVALHNVNLSIKKGEFVFVLGHSGAGKSTFLKLILREEAATEGKVFVNGRDLSSIRQREIPYLRRGLGVVFQDFRLIPTMTAYENVAFAMRVTNIPERQIKRRVPYVLNLVGLAGKAHSLPQELSGGEQQRIALARALVHSPPIIIADEPTGNIDPELSVEIMELLQAYDIPVEGKRCVVIGRSNIVGKPMAMLLLHQNGTVTICHSRTKDLPEVTRQADILVSAVGKSRFVTADMVKPGAVVIDVGMNRDENGKLCGDVDFAAVEPVASYITPVPGGVGPMTIAMLLKNTVTAAKLQNGLL